MTDNAVTTIKLEYPVTSGNQEITEITLARPKAKHLKGVKLNDLTIEDLMVMSGKLSGLTSNIIDELDVVDLNKIIQKLTDFL